MVKVLLGIGNSQKGDDGVGPYIAQTFQHPEWVVLNCETAPENFTSLLRKLKPTLVIIVDAADMGVSPGEYYSISPERLVDISLGTHGPSLVPLIKYLSTFISQLLFIGIQPVSIREGEGLSLNVKAGAHAVISLLESGRIEKVPKLENYLQR